MKKILLIPALVLGSFASNAQLALENFNSGTLPSGWVLINDGHTVSTSFASTTTLHTDLTANAWVPYQVVATGDYSMITSSLFTPAATADRWMITPSFTVTSPNTVFEWQDYDLGSAENLQVLISTTAGTTAASFTTTLSSAPAGADAIVTHAVSLTAYNGTTVRLAFRDNTTNNWGLIVDNVQTAILPNLLDGSLDNVTFPSLVSTTSSTPVSFVVSNQGATTITSLQLSYAVDGGTPVTQTFSGLNVNPLSSTTVSFTTPITSPSVGSHSILGTILQVNGGTDPVATNNTKTVNFSVATKSVTRSGLIEEFSSATCVPCAAFNLTFDPLVVSSNGNVPSSNFNIIKYQMNWPSPGTDVSYNSQGLTRRTYYGVNAIPDHFTNGAAGGAGDAAEIAASKTPPAYMDISGTYIATKDSLIADVTVTPYFTISAANFKVHLASTEYHYVNSGATTTQKDYYHVMRNMAGSGSGFAVTSWTSGVPQTFHWAQKYTVGTVAQMSNTYWNAPIGDGNLVVFVQDNNDQSILQSQVVPATWPLGIQSLNSVISQAVVYPNPATDHTSIAFKLETSSTIGVQVLDALGRVVYTVADQKMNAGTQMIEIPTTSFAGGIYTIKVQSDAGAITERFSVNK